MEGGMIETQHASKSYIHMALPFNGQPKTSGGGEELD